MIVNTLSGMLMAYSCLQWKFTHNVLFTGKLKNIIQTIFVHTFILAVGTIIFGGGGTQHLYRLPMLVNTLEYVKWLCCSSSVLCVLKVKQVTALMLFIHVGTVLILMLPVLLLYPAFNLSVDNILVDHLTDMAVWGFKGTVVVGSLLQFTVLYKLSRKLNRLVYDQLYKKHDYTMVNSNPPQKHTILKAVQSDIKLYINLRKTMKQNIVPCMLFHGVGLISLVMDGTTWHISLVFGMNHLNTILTSLTILDGILSIRQK